MGGGASAINSNFHAGGTLGPIDVLDDANGAAGILNAHFRGDAGMGAVNVVVDGQNVYTGASSATPTTFTTGIKGAFFTTGGNMGAIQVALGVATNTAIDTTVFAASGSLGKITVTGNVNKAKFLAGVDLGTDLTFGGAGTAQDTFFDGTSIGNILITGQLLGSDIAASINPGGDGKYGTGAGGNADANVGPLGGTIGTVSLQTGSVFNGTLQAYTSAGETNGIEAKVIGTVVLGSQALAVAVATPGSEIDWAGNGFNAGVDIAVRQIP